MAGDTLTFDPEALAPSRTPLALGELGLAVREQGADWGESQVDLDLVRAQFGETVSGRHLPNVEIQVPILAKPEGETTLAEAAQRLQAKVGLWQAEGEGWLERAFSEGGFAGAVAYRVHGASLSGLQGWMMANRLRAPDVVLKAVRSPLAYAVVEAESAEYSEEEERELIFALSEMLGTAPGLIRLRVTNDNEEGDWRGLIVAGECRDHPQDATKDTTAKLAYPATDLTAVGDAEEAEREEVPVIRHSSLTAGWLTILDSEISAEELGHMTHKGVRQIWLRVYDPGEEAGEVELRLRWRALGTLRWSENAIVPTPLVDGFAPVDMGECRPELAAVGNERWEFQVQARAPDGSGEIDIARVWVAPTEQYAVLKAPGTSQGADAQEQQSPGEGESDNSTGTVEWSNPNNAKSSDDSYATAGMPAFATSHVLVLKNFGFGLPEGATVIGAVASAEVKASESNRISSFLTLVKNGEFGLTPEFLRETNYWPTSDTVFQLGGSEDLWNRGPISVSEVNAADFGIGIVCVCGVGGATAYVDTGTLTVYYTEATDPNRICFATRSIELRSDGVVRQHETDDVWGKLIPDGFNLYYPPSGLEGRESRWIVIPTQGDLEGVEDSGSNKLTAQVFSQAGYHFASEAS